MHTPLEMAAYLSSVPNTEPGSGLRHTPCKTSYYQKLVLTAFFSRSAYLAPNNVKLHVVMGFCGLKMRWHCGHGLNVVWWLGSRWHKKAQTCQSPGTHGQIGTLALRLSEGLLMDETMHFSVRFLLNSSCAAEGSLLMGAPSMSTDISITRC